MLADCPAEILVAIAEELSEIELQSGQVKPNLLHFLQTCKRIYDTAKGVLYRSLRYDGTRDNEGTRLGWQIGSLYQGVLLHHVHHLDLRNWYHSAPSDVWLTLATMTDFKVWSPNTAGSFLFQGATNLRSLNIDYPPDGQFLNIQSNTIQSLSVRPSFDPMFHPQLDVSKSPASFPMDGPLRVDFLPYVLSWPRLRVLSLRAVSIWGELGLLAFGDTLGINSSPVTDLTLCLGNFTDHAMYNLLRIPRALRSFTYIPPTSEDVRDPWAHGSSADMLPKTSQIASALLMHSETLERLTIARAGSYWNERMDNFGSLRQFTALRYLEIDATMILGWEHCEHQVLADDEVFSEVRTVSAWDFAASLPTSLESLTVVIDRHLSGEPLQSYISALVEGTASQIKTGSLPNLQRFTVRVSKCRYCLTCEGITDRHSEAIGQDRGSVFSASESARLQNLMSEYSCEFSFVKS